MEQIPRMQTGLLDAPRNIPPFFRERWIAIIMSMYEQTMKTAYLYTEHAGRDQVTDTDIEYALMHNARTFLKLDNLESIVIDMHERMKAAEDEESESEEDEEEDEDEGEGEDEEGEYNSEDDEDYVCSESEEGEEPFVRSTCQCAECQKVNEHVDTWDAWSPTDEAEMYLKATIDKSLEALLSVGV